MIGLDMRTVMLSHVITGMLSLIVVSHLWRQNRGRYHGLSYWPAGFGLQLLGTILIILRGAIPDIISMTLANVVILAGAMTVVGGLARFLGRPRSPLPGAAVLGLYALASLFFVLVRPSLEARNLVFSLVFILIFVEALRLISEIRDPLRRMIRRIAVAYGLLLLVTLTRVVLILAGPPENQDFFKAALVETLVLLAYQTLFILLTYDLALTVNERLIGDLRFQEEKFAKAFRASPFGIALIDAFSEKILEVNEGFTDITGYAREEALEKTISELGVWVSPDERQKRVEDLRANGRVRDAEFQLRTKRGEILPCLCSAESLTLAGRPCFLTSINNIVILKQAQEALGRSLEEKDLLMRELRHRVKNSLSVVASLVNLSREEAAEPAIRTVLSDIRSRIGSVSSIYEQLDRTGRVDVIGLNEYIRSLAESLAKSYGPADGRIRITTDLQDIALETSQALPLGLIVNELVINALKYAFPGGMSGEIRIEIMPQAEGVCLIVSDDGIGRTGGNVSEGEGTGSMIIDMLADQIGARISRPPGPGTTVVVVL